jgi:hypothetical protein
MPALLASREERMRWLECLSSDRPKVRLKLDIPLTRFSVLSATDEVVPCERGKALALFFGDRVLSSASCQKHLQS